MPCPDHPLYDVKQGKPRGENASCEKCLALWKLRLRRQRWKRRERDTAKKAGSIRNPGSGSPDRPGDVYLQWGAARLFSVIEHRDRKNWNVFAWIKEVQEEARKTKTGKPWLLVLTKPGVHGSFAVIDCDVLFSFLPNADQSM